ncbi:MAG TPA: radical SAM peptide maturase [Flavobacterium sp.]|nr:radical SAM peptide maturase [Flavobacterium sp.]
MIQSIIHTSETNNFYLYNDQFRLSMLIHPEFNKIHEKSMNCDPYYEKKYLYLKNHGFFSESKLPNLNTVVNESMVKESIAQTAQIVFEVTDSCNLNCTYCVLGELYHNTEDRKSRNSRNIKNINIHSAINLLKYIFELKAYKDPQQLAISFYGGEPLLNIKFIKQIVEVVHSLSSEKQMKIGFNMTTNATLIDKHIDFLIANNFNILISLDGNKENNSYRVFRNKNDNSFEKIIDNIDIIQRTYPKYFKSNINFNAVLHNKNSVKDVFEFIYNRYQKIPQISELNNINIDPTKRDIFENMFHDARKSEIEYHKEKDNLLRHNEVQPYKELTDFLKYLSVNSYISNIVSSTYNEDKYFPSSTCLPFQKKIFLTTSKKLLPCERINSKYSMGKVEGNVVIDIQEIAKKYSFYYEHLKKVCHHCYMYRFCGVCMFHIEDLNKLDKGERHICDFFHNQNAFRSKLYRVISLLEKHPNYFFEILEDIVIIA